MFSLLKKPAAAAPVPQSEAPSPHFDARALIEGISREASSLGRDAAEVRGAIDDTIKAAGAQAQKVQALAQQLGEVTQGQHAIVDETGSSTQAVERARQRDHRRRQRGVGHRRHAARRVQCGRADHQDRAADPPGGVQRVGRSQARRRGRPRLQRGGRRGARTGLEGRRVVAPHHGDGGSARRAHRSAGARDPAPGRRPAARQRAPGARRTGAGDGAHPGRCRSRPRDVQRARSPHGRDRTRDAWHQHHAVVDAAAHRRLPAGIGAADRSDRGLRHRDRRQPVHQRGAGGCRTHRHAAGRSLAPRADHARRTVRRALCRRSPAPNRSST